MANTLTEWKITSWGNLATLEYGKGLRGYQNSDGQYPVFGTNGQIGWHNECLYPNGGVIVGRKGAYRGIHYSDSPFFVIDTAFYLKPIVDGSFSTKWAYYQLLDFDINKMDSGSAIPSTSRDAFYALQLYVPPLPTQRKIASVLSAYDDLIENNLRRIKILEEMAQALYREWFVKFRFPGHEKVRMVDSSLGKIPEGWEVSTLSKVAIVIPGYAFKSKDWSDSGVPVIKIKNIRPGNLVNSEQIDHVPEDILSAKHKKYWIQHGDILIAMTGATAGKVGKLRSKKRMLLNQRVAKIKPEKHFEEFVWCSVCNPDAEKIFYALADGAAQPNMSGSQIENIDLLIPAQNLLQQFNGSVSPLLHLIDNMILRNQTLHQTRDLLLPRLISGELDVSDLEINIPEEAP